MNEAKKTVRWYEAAYIVVLLGVLALSMTYLRPHRMGVIDMEQAYNRLGVVERVKTELQAREKAAQARLEQFQRGLQAEERALMAAYRSAQSDEQRAKAEADLAQFRNKVQRGRAEIAGELQLFNRNVLFTFRERMRPYVIEVASRKRVDIVIEPADVFQIMNNAVNLTDQVIDAAQEKFNEPMPLVDEELLKSKGLWIEPQRAGEQPGVAAPAAIPAAPGR